MASTYTAAQLLLWKRLYGFNGWTTGPDTIGALLYGAAFFNVTSGDATCQINPLTALSSGADGEAIGGGRHCGATSTMVQVGGVARMSRTWSRNPCF